MSGEKTIPSSLAQPSKIWSATAQPLHGGAILVAMETKGDIKEGPWSVVTDLPGVSRQMLGPPPVYLALAGWAT